MSIITSETKPTSSAGGEDFWKARITKKGKPKPAYSRENVSLLPIEIIVQQVGTNYYPPRKVKGKKS